jgi:NADH-quinone oxidoreductase subunit L
MTEMGGLRKAMPVTFLATTVGLAALAGVPPFSGFFSKEAILAAAEHGTDSGLISVAAGALVLISALLTVLVTAAYVMRLWLMTFFGVARTVDLHPHEAPALMSVPVVLLAIPSALLGFAAPLVPGWISSSDVEPESLAPAAASVGISVLLVFVGGYVTYAAWVRARQGDPAQLLGRYRRAVERAFYVDELYDTVFVRPVRAFASGVVFTDRVVVDTYVEGSGTAAQLAAAVLRRTQTGNVQTYLTGLLAIVVVGLVVVAGTAA